MLQAIMHDDPTPPSTYGQDTDAYHTSHKTSQDLGGGSQPRSRLLDWPSDPHPILDILIQEGLWQLYCSGDGATMRYDAEPGGSGEDAGSHLPYSGVLRDIEDFAARYARCWNHRARLAVIWELQREILRNRLSPDRSKVRGTQEWREAIAADERPSRVVAALYGISHMQVTRIRKAHKK